MTFTAKQQLIRVAHSPDSDDAFMFYALARNKLNTGQLCFTHELKDIETLNRLALQGVYEVTAISFHTYAYVAERYALMSSGASMGFRYGPIVVAREELSPQDLQGRVIAVPGEMTTAFLTLKLCQPDFVPLYLPFDKIVDAVVGKHAEAGLLIHEGQLTYSTVGLHKIIDMGEWWYERHGLPLPLGGNAIRRDLGAELTRQISRLLRESILYSLNHREEAIAYALQFARGLDADLADRFVGMYVNDLTLGYSPESRHAVALLLEEGYRAGIIPNRVIPEFVED